ncbi:MAG: 5-(carboxyamino)imidazole ribonucleotide mutase [Acidobacteriota bacterium]|jgi:5-(carboxyamino)imidazole ribonucleotide mutase
MSTEKKLVSILMGSASDFERVKPCMEVLQNYGIPHEVHVRSAHRTPQETADYVKDAENRGVEVFIAAAGMAAHLAGAVAAHSFLPVIGLPLAAGPLNGLDALYATVMMPPGLPVATVGVNGAANAAHLAVQIMQGAHPEFKNLLRDKRESMKEKVLRQDAELPR